MSGEVAAGIGGGGQGGQGEEGAGGGFRVLFLGEGNFSFSLALAELLFRPSPDQLQDNAAARFLLLDAARALQRDATCTGTGTTGGSRLCLQADRISLTCTSFDSQEEVLRKYPECRQIFASLLSFPNVTLQHDVNAWELPSQYPGETFDAVVWNHPHLGVEDFRLHRFLMAHFLSSAASCLTPRGYVSVSLVTGQEERWALDAQAEKAGLAPLDAQPFGEASFPGYICKRNKNGQSFKNTHTKLHTQSTMKSHSFKYARPAVCAGFRRHLAAPAALTTLKKAAVAASTDPAAADSDPGTRDRRKKKLVTDAKFECIECKRGFASARALKSHTNQVHRLKQCGANWQPNMPKVLPCPDCDKMFHDAEARWQHCVAKHSFDQDIQANRPLTDAEKARGGAPVHFVACGVCGQAVPEDWGMVQHLETLKPLVGLHAECLVCRKPFIEHRALRQHLNFCKLRKENRAKARAAAADGGAGRGEEGPGGVLAMPATVAGRMRARPKRGPQFGAWEGGDEEEQGDVVVLCA